MLNSLGNGPSVWHKFSIHWWNTKGSVAMCFHLAYVLLARVTSWQAAWLGNTLSCWGTCPYVCFFLLLSKPFLLWHWVCCLPIVGFFFLRYWLPALVWLLNQSGCEGVVEYVLQSVLCPSWCEHALAEVPIQVVLFLKLTPVNPSFPGMGGKA